MAEPTHGTLTAGRTLVADPARLRPRRAGGTHRDPPRRDQASSSLQGLFPNRKNACTSGRLSRYRRLVQRVIGYARVSTEGQAGDGYGLAVQEQVIHSWCRAAGKQLIGIARDEGVSGAADHASRPGLAEALASLKRREATALVVYRLDRLARDYVLQETLLRDIWRMGADTFSTSPTEGDLRDDPADPSRKLIRQVLGAISEYERDLIRLRMMAGREAKRASGGYAGGQPPYGFRAHNRSLVPDDAEQAVVAAIRQLRSEGRSLREIASQLTRDGHAPRRGRRWHPTQVQRLLSRERRTT